MSFIVNLRDWNLVSSFGRQIEGGGQKLSTRIPASCSAADKKGMYIMLAIKVKKLVSTVRTMLLLTNRTL